MLRFIPKRVRRFFAFRAPEMLLVTFAVVFFVVVFRHEMFVSIGPGHYGVLWRRFGGGTDTQHLFGEGIHIILPTDKMYIFNGQIQVGEEKLDVLSSDGLKMVVDVVYRFSLNPDEIGDLAKYVGPHYQEKLIAPQVASMARNSFSNNTPEEIFSRRREDIEAALTGDVQKRMDTMFKPDWRPGPALRFVKVWDVLIRGITLPQSVAAAIEAKNRAKQKNEAYDFRLLSEAKEAQRKEIEAAGIEKFQLKVSPGLTESYLQWQGIQATERLAKSNNAKIVVIGAGKSGLPVILGGLDDGKTDTELKLGPSEDTENSDEDVAYEDVRKDASSGAETDAKPTAVGGKSSDKATPGKSSSAKPAAAKPTSSGTSDGAKP
ncbi:prohibitin family protein [Rhodospirillum sp. A1_3_36]|uniref:prohibitin family protein n=1 Tax=Rhodospirillum sp. A1_3_36 TaxID=3391666 RepID=UPI0039A63DFA